MIWTLRRSGDVYPCKCWGRAKCHPVKSPQSQVKDSWRTGAGKGWKEKWREEKDGRKSLGSTVERDQTTHGKGFVMQRAGTGLCSPVSARSHRASRSCPPSPREHHVAKGSWIVHWALRTVPKGRFRSWRQTGGGKWEVLSALRCGQEGRTKVVLSDLQMSLLQSGSSFEQFSVCSLETFLSSTDGIFVLSTLSCDFSTCHLSPSSSYE